MISGPIYGPSSKRKILVGVLPLVKADGAFDGTLNIAIDVNWLDALLRYKRLPRDAVVALFDRSGKLIASSNPEVAAFVFAKGASAVNGRSGLLQGTGPNNEAWSFAMAPLIRRDTYVGFAMPEADLFTLTYVHVATDLLLPVLMIALASAAIWYAADRLVVRWIVILQRVAVAYARGHYAVRPAALQEAPREFRDLGNTLADMAQAIQERDTKLRDAVTQKTTLIKEIHHRVKNNLQIVMSLLSLQANKMRDSAAREALDQARTRVNALALVHRILYELDNAGLVDMRALWTELVEQLHQSFGGERRGIQMKVDVAEQRAVSADIAIPLTLFTVEALTNAYKHAFDTKGSPRVLDLCLKPGDPGRLKLMIVDTGVGIDRQRPGGDPSTGSRLMAAFAQQVNGHIITRAREGGGTIVELDFPDPTLPPSPTEGARAAA
jgi:two-component sensor histidine kinase